MNVNLSNPIFVYYVNIEGLTQKVLTDLLTSIKEEYTCSNINFWIVPVSSGLTRIEMLYQGR